MSDTPRTDARIVKMFSPLQSGTEDVVHADLARELERENAKLRADLAKSERRWLSLARCVKAL